VPRATVGPRLPGVRMPPARMGQKRTVGVQWAYEASSHHSTRRGITLAWGAVPRNAFMARSLSHSVKVRNMR
jgi:hypothetical protein